MPIGSQISMQLISNSLCSIVQVYLEHSFYTKFNSEFCFWLFIQFHFKLLFYFPFQHLCLLFSFMSQNTICDLLNLSALVTAPQPGYSQLMNSCLLMVIFYWHVLQDRIKSLPKVKLGFINLFSMTYQACHFAM